MTKKYCGAVLEYNSDVDGDMVIFFDNTIEGAKSYLECVEIMKKGKNNHLSAFDIVGESASELLKILEKNYDE